MKKTIIIFLLILQIFLSSLLFFKNDSFKEVKGEKTEREVFEIIYVTKEGGSIFPNIVEVEKGKDVEIKGIYADLEFEFSRFEILNGSGNILEKQNIIKNIESDLVIMVVFVKKELEKENVEIFEKTHITNFKVFEDFHREEKRVEVFEKEEMEKEPEKTEEKITKVVEKKEIFLEYVSLENAGILGFPFQKIEQGFCTTPVEVVVMSGFEFVSWSDGKLENPRIDCDVEKGFRVFPIVEKKKYEVRYTAVGGGSMTKEFEIVEHGGSSLGLEYEAFENHEFSFFDIGNGWQNGKLNYDTGIVSDVVGDMEIVVFFNIKKYTITWSASTGGAVSPTRILLSHGQTSLAPSVFEHEGTFSGFVFISGSENADLDSNTGVVSNIVGDVEIRAEFEIF